jgi:DNA-binding transcriptional MerR regulator
MSLLSLDELIEEAKKRNIDLGEDPKKTIMFYSRLGFLPKPKRKRVKSRGGDPSTLYYPEQTIDKLAYIRALKSEGLTLDEIRETFALEYVQNALRDLLSRTDDDKIVDLARIIGSGSEELESIVMAPLVYVVEGMAPEEAKKLLTLFCGVGFYALLEAQQNLEEFKLEAARLALAKAIFYNSIAVLRLARTTGDKGLEETAAAVYEKVVLEPIAKASERVRKEFMSSLETYLKDKLSREES